MSLFYRSDAPPLAPQVGIAHEFEHAGHTLTWEEHSSGDHSIIFIHGYSGNRAIWSQELARLAHLGRCVTLDLPGHYPAQAPHGYRSLSQEQLIDLETQAVRQIAGDQPVTLIGHSTGGLVALGVAARLPRQVARVVSISSVVWGPATGALGHMQRALRLGGHGWYWLACQSSRLSLRLLMEGIARIYVHDGWAFLQNEVAWRACHAWFPAYRRTDIASCAVLLQTLETCDIRPLIAGMAAPVLAITGAHDPVVPAEQSYWLASHLPRAELRVFEGVGHLPQWEAADRFGQVVERWLSRDIL